LRLKTEYKTDTERWRGERLKNKYADIGDLQTFQLCETDSRRNMVYGQIKDTLRARHNCFGKEEEELLNKEKDLVKAFELHKTMIAPTIKDRALDKLINYQADLMHGHKCLRSALTEPETLKPSRSTRRRQTRRARSSRPVART